MNIYAGNLSRDLSEDELRQAFEEFGQVDTAKIITDRLSGASRGFGFVEMPDEAEANEAMTNLNGKELKGRTIVVSKARPRRERPQDGRRSW